MFSDKATGGPQRPRERLKGALVVRLMDTTAVFGGEKLASGSGAIICSAARELIARGYDANSRLEAWRGDTLSLAGTPPLTICRWSGLRPPTPMSSKYEAPPYSRIL